MCDLSGRLFSVPPVTIGERVRRRIVRKLLVWRAAPAHPSAPSRDLTAHVGTFFQMRNPHQQTPRVRLDRVVLVSEHVWVSMETDRNDRWKFGSVVVVPDDALVRGTRGLVLSLDSDYFAVQRIPSGDLPVFVNRAVDGMLPSMGDSRNFRDEPFPLGQDEKVDKTNLRNRLSIQSPADEERLQTICGPSGLNIMPRVTDKTWRDFTREATLEIYKDWPFDDGRSAVLYMVKHF